MRIPTSLRSKRLLRSSIIVLAVTLIGWLALIWSKESDATITTSGGTFSVSSVWIEHGTEHTAYYPNRFHYVLSQAKRFVRLPDNSDVRRIDRTTSVESLAVWMRWTSDKGHFSQINPRGYLTGSTNTQFSHWLYQPAKKSGLLLWISTEGIKDVSGRTFEVKTSAGNATVKFR